MAMTTEAPATAIHVSVRASRSDFRCEKVIVMNAPPLMQQGACRHNCHERDNQPILTVAIGNAFDREARWKFSRSPLILEVMRTLGGVCGGQWRSTLAFAIALSTACGRIGFDPETNPLAADASVDGEADVFSCAMIDNRPPVPAFDCGTVEGQILAGNIASVSNADLIAWAQNDCMVKPAPSAVAAMDVSTAFPVTVGTGPSCASGAPPDSSADGYTGSGTLNLGSVSGSCGPTNLLGSYEQIYFATIDTTEAVSTHYDGCRTIHVDRLAGGALLRAFDSANGSVSGHAAVLRLSSTESTSQIAGGGGNDVVIVTGRVRGNSIATGAGDDTVMIGDGLLTDDANDTFLRLGDGNDTAYVRLLGILGGNPESDIYGGRGDDRIYFNEFVTEDIFAEDGNDVLSCTGLFGIASCTNVREWAFLVGGNGNDIISVDGPLIQTSATDGSTTVTGDAGFNIIYLKSISNTANRRVTIDVTTTGESLLVIGGDHTTSQATTITAAGANNVLLVKSGSTNTGFTFTGFARTLSY